MVGLSFDRPRRRLAAVAVLVLLLGLFTQSVAGGSVPADIASHWAKTDILYLYDLNVLQWATGAGGLPSFQPDRPITRCDFAVWLCRMLGIEPVETSTFTDLGGIPEKGYIEAAAAKGLIKGVGGGRFAPNDPIARAAAATLLSRFYKLVGSPAIGFPDVAATHWASAHIRLAASVGLFKGDQQGRFSPVASISRAEAATVLARAARTWPAPSDADTGLAGTPWPRPGCDTANRSQSSQKSPASPPVLFATPAPSTVIAGTGEAAQLCLWPEEPVVGSSAGGVVYVGSVGGLVAVIRQGESYRAWRGGSAPVSSPVIAMVDGGNGERVGVAVLASNESDGGIGDDSSLLVLSLAGSPEADPESSWLDSPACSLKLAGTIVGSPVVAPDGTVYAVTAPGSLYSLTVDLREGDLSVNWVVGPDVLGGVVGPPALAPDGTVYVAAGGGHLLAVAPSGSKLWDAALQVEMNGPPAVGTDGTVYVGATNGTLAAVRPQDGGVKWTSKPSDAAVCAGPAVGPSGTIVVGCADRRVYALAPTDGKTLFSADLKDFPTGLAIAADGCIYVGTASGQLKALSNSGAQMWTFDPQNLPASWTEVCGQPYIAQPALGSAPVINSDGTIWFRSGGWLWVLGS